MDDFDWANHYFEFDMSVVWQWDNDGSWTDFDHKNTLLLETEYQQNNQGWCNLYIQNNVYTISFKHMTQENTSTKMRRKIQRKIPKSILWEWESSPGKWLAFDQTTNDVVEKEYQKNPNATLKTIIFGTTYTIDLKAMEQQNMISFRKRRIARAKKYPISIMGDSMSKRVSPQSSPKIETLSLDKDSFDFIPMRTKSPVTPTLSKKRVTSVFDPIKLDLYMLKMEKSNMMKISQNLLEYSRLHSSDDLEFHIIAKVLSENKKKEEIGPFSKKISRDEQIHYEILRSLKLINHYTQSFLTEGKKIDDYLKTESCSDFADIIFLHVKKSVSEFTIGNAKYKFSIEETDVNLRGVYYFCDSSEKILFEFVAKMNHYFKESRYRSTYMEIFELAKIVYSESILLESLKLCPSFHENEKRTKELQGHYQKAWAIATRKDLDQCVILAHHIAKVVEKLKLEKMYFGSTDEGSDIIVRSSANPFIWTVQLKNYKKSGLVMESNDMDTIQLEVRFPVTYPTEPPLIRITNPRIGSSNVSNFGLVLEHFLTPQGWVCNFKMVDVLKQIRARICHSGVSIMHSHELSYPMPTQFIIDRFWSRRPKLPTTNEPNTHFFVFSATFASATMLNFFNDKMERGNNIIVPSEMDMLFGMNFQKAFCPNVEISTNHGLYYCGVLESTGPKDILIFPTWLMQEFHLVEGDVVKMRGIQCEKGLKVIFRPESKTFWKISNPMGALTHTLGYYSTLAQGQFVRVLDDYGKAHFVEIVSLEPSPTVNIDSINDESSNLKIEFIRALDMAENEVISTQ